MVSDYVLDGTWIDDGSLDDSETGAGRSGTWKTFVDTNFTASAEDAADTWKSKLEQANEAVVAEWELATAAAGVGDVSKWMSGDGIAGELSADAEKLAEMFAAIRGGDLSCLEGYVENEETDGGKHSLLVLKSKLDAVAASPKWHGLWLGLLETMHTNMPVETVLDLRAALQRIVAAIDSAHPFTDLAMNDSAIESYVEVIPDID